MSNEQILILVYSLILVVLLFLSMFFSSSDMVYGSVNINKLERMYNENPTKKSLRRGYKLANEYDQTISTILLLNDTVNAGLDTIATLLGVNIALIVFKDNPNIETISETFGLSASLIVLVFKITFGEIIAKSIGKIYNLKFSVLYSNIINGLRYLFFPITIFVTTFGKIVSYPITKNVNEIKIGDDELHEMVDEIEESGVVDEDKAELLHGTIDYASTEAYEIMTPRVDVYAIDINDDLNEVLKDERTYIYSRIPVYEDSIDNIIGYVLTKTLVRIRLENKEVAIKDILLKHLTFPRSMEINDILIRFKETHQHFAVILDEYGGTEGVLTMEDILEEIVGEIWDESDDPEEPYVKTKNGSYIVDGKMNLEDFCDLFDLDYEEIDTEYVTIGGFCIELLDDNFAKLNDVIIYKNLEMKVIAIDEKQTIEKLKIKVNEKEEEDKPFHKKVIESISGQDD